MGACQSAEAETQNYLEGKSRIVWAEQVAVRLQDRLPPELVGMAEEWLTRPGLVLIGPFKIGGR